MVGGCGEPQIDDLDVIPIVNDDVFQFEVSVDDGLLGLGLRMHVFNALDELLNEDLCGVESEGFVAFIAHVLI